MAANYTDTYSLMLAIRVTLRKHLAFDTTNTFKKVKSWNLGFIFPETILPSITVFPVSKTFLPKRSGGVQPVQYRYSVDIYSRKHRYLHEAKQFCLDASEAVIEALMSNRKMRDKAGTAHCYNVVIEDVSVLEGKDDQDRNLLSKVSIEVMCEALHQMNESRETQGHVSYATSDEFHDLVFEQVKSGVVSPSRIKGWQHKISKRVAKFPTVLILPQSEVIDSEYTNHNDLVARSYAFHVLHRGYPKKELLRDNIQISDMLVNSIEKKYMLGGKCLSSTVNSVQYNYGDIDSEFNFYSSVLVDYFTRRQFKKVTS